MVESGQKTSSMKEIIGKWLSEQGCDPSSHDPCKYAINGRKTLGKWWNCSVHRLLNHSCTLTKLVNVSRKLEEVSKIVSISSVQRKQVRTEC